jgi:endonuclease YncB( thermonuclease family)
MKKLSLLSLMAILLMSGIAIAQEAPTPNRAPRTPVNRQAVVAAKPVIAPATVVQGTATIIDSERIRMGDIDMRLFGVVTPQLSAPFGPQARTFLDNLVLGQTVNCVIRDRDQSGRFLATCRNSENNDLALELLKRGLAVTARGSLASTDLLTPYANAEQAAQAQKIGLWSGAVPPAAKIDAASAATVAAVAALPAPAPVAPPVETKKEEQAAAKIDKDAAAQVQAKVSSAAMAASALAPDDDIVVASPSVGFLARYQLMITGILMLATALSIIAAISSQRRRERIDERKAIAAALRGELMAARAVCLGRFKLMTNEADDKSATWPRIRATLYQAYVGRLGFLGAELARQIASIYGQASDYAAYYNTKDDEAQKDNNMPKRQALQNLVNYIEEVLPKLATIELTGHLTGNLVAAHPPMAHSTSHSAPHSVPPHRPASIVTTHEHHGHEHHEAAAQQPAAAPVTHENPTQEEPAYHPAASNPVKLESVAKPRVQAANAVEDEDNAQQKTSGNDALHEAEAAQEILASHPQVLSHPIDEPDAAAAPATSKPPLWDTVRRFARNRFVDIRPEAHNEDHDTDYASMIEEDMANMSFSDTDEDEAEKLPDHLAKIRHTGS